jgi:citrate lyase gamma subunit
MSNRKSTMLQVKIESNEKEKLFVDRKSTIKQSYNQKISTTTKIQLKIEGENKNSKFVQVKIESNEKEKKFGYGKSTINSPIFSKVISSNIDKIQMKGVLNK